MKYTCVNFFCSSHIIITDTEDRSEANANDERNTTMAPATATAVLAIAATARFTSAFSPLIRPTGSRSNTALYGEGLDTLRDYLKYSDEGVEKMKDERARGEKILN